MTFTELIKKYSFHPSGESVNKYLSGTDKTGIQIIGLKGSARSIFASSIILKHEYSHLFILENKESAAYFQNELKELLPDRIILFLPSTYQYSHLNRSRKVDEASQIMHTEVLDALDKPGKKIIVTYPEAIAEKAAAPEEVAKNKLELQTGEEIDLNFMQELLIEFGFERVDFVYSPGQFAVRGSIVDVFSFSDDVPYRIDFFDKEIESLRKFDPVNQLSQEVCENISILPNIKQNTRNKVPIFRHLCDNFLIWRDNPSFIRERIQEIKEEDPDNQNFISLEEYEDLISNFHKPDFILGASDGNQQVFFDTGKHVNLNKNFALFAQELARMQADGYQNIIISKHPKQNERLLEILKSEEILEAAGLDKKEDITQYFQFCSGILHEGFQDNDLKINCYTEHQIYGKYHKYSLRSTAYYKNKETLTLKEFKNLQPGDFVVHVDHGIGQFGGLTLLSKEDKKQEALRLVYRNNDILLVNIHNIHKISKYKGKEGTQPKVHKLGGGTWDKTKSKTKSRVKDIARELIALYAKRKSEKGFAFSPDSFLQHTLESSFIYEDTPDQSKATEAVKKDMESEIPMDRLICGDVGFGKTEVAVRAAFKAVADNKQVAVLVPTTVLSLQHYKTFQSRLKDFPCKIDFISRLKSTGQQKETLKNLAEGKTDIIIGTHRLVSKDVKFKDLGLMIVDEEQKFGVAVKDKLKALKVNVDTLTLTATPIPRTLQFSLMGARDLSIINTPPPNRYPIHTELLQFDQKLIQKALDFEYKRNGQVFFIHNRVNDIYRIESLLNKLAPYAQTGVIHGQMKPSELENVMTGFINEEYDILIATAIVESGLDIPNANTIIINNAQNFGLSDLHQLRGRVGRSDKKAFCYLLTPPIQSLNNESQLRLRAVETFSELGSGFNIAMQDLDIRGAGNLLGGEQSGFISDIGMETYKKILDEAILELREEEFQSIFQEKENNSQQAQSSEHKFVNDCHIDTDLEVLLPESYIQNTEERLKLYQRLDNISQESDLQIFEEELKDRFGSLPPAAVSLLNAVRLREKAISLGMEKILLHNQKMVCFSVYNRASAFYSSPIFSKLLEFVKKHPKDTRMKEHKDKLMTSFDKIKSIEQALDTLHKISIIKIES
ncbi:MAG: transcription-repair coupling factor [Bacteroidia bacterium]|nr:MAG: transcription-repair coupling factor [Bacteroidia bacterium]